jgi:hypothetical protein
MDVGHGQVLDPGIVVREWWDASLFQERGDVLTQDDLEEFDAVPIEEGKEVPQREFGIDLESVEEVPAQLVRATRPYCLIFAIPAYDDMA